MTAVRPQVPVSVPLDAASALAPGAPGTGTGVSDIGIGVSSNGAALDQKTDARISSAPTDDEHKASVGSNGQAPETGAAGAAAAPAANVPLPTNRTQKDLDEYKKRMDANLKLQKKMADALAKKCAKSPKAAGCTVTGAPPTTAKPTNAPAAAQQ
jgi:hypothetical protein